MSDVESCGSTVTQHDLQTMSAWLIRQRAQNTTKIMTALVDMALEEIVQGKKPLEKTWTEIAKRTCATDKIPPSAMGQYADPETRGNWFKTHRESYLQHCVENKANALLMKEGSRGSRAVFGLEVDQNPQPGISEFTTMDGCVRWRRTKVLAQDITWLGRHVYPEGRYQIKGWRKIAIFTDAAWHAIIFMILAGCAWLCLVGATGGIEKSRGTSITGLVIYTILLGWFFFGHMKPKMRNMDLRTQHVHPWISGMTQDIWTDRINGNSGRSKTDPLYDPKLQPYRELVHWAADCPICEAPLELKMGSPVLPKELVGCCFESPDEHCFSFDRVTLEGRALRARPATPA